MLVYSTLPREDELAEFQQLNLARGNVSEHGLVSSNSKIIDKVKKRTAFKAGGTRSSGPRS